MEVEEREDREDGVEWPEESKPMRCGKAEISLPNRTVQRNPLSKFSACSPRETVARKTIDRTRISTMPEVRLLAEKR